MSMLERDDLLTAYAVPDRETPRVRMNFVSSIDGSATLHDRSGGLGDEDDQRIMGVLRELADVVLVGAGTVRAEGYSGLDRPLAVVSSSLDLDAGSELFTKAKAPVMILTHDGVPSARREALDAVADVISCGSASVDLRRALIALAERGLTQVLCEGGPHLFGDLVSADLVDELCLTLSPVVVGGTAGRIVRGASEAARRMRLLHALPSEAGMLFLRYVRAAV